MTLERKTHRQRNEGMACDAVLRWIEAREGTQRADVKLHDRDPDPKARVELTCRIGARMFAIEHSFVEPFEGHTTASIRFQTLQESIRAKVMGGLPLTGNFLLFIPAKSLNGLKNKDIRAIEDGLAKWILEVAASLPIAAFGEHGKGVSSASLPGIPFTVTLHRRKSGPFPAPFSIGVFVGANLEADRRERIKRTYADKCPKLKTHKDAIGARTVLILEEDDIALTNHSFITEAIRDIENECPNKPDEIYLVESSISPWFIHRIRVDNKYFNDSENWGDRVQQINPEALLPLTRSA